MAKKLNKKKLGIIEPRINDEIYGYNEVRVVFKEDDNNFSEVMSLKEAKIFAENKGYDLIEINNKVQPPILKVADYSKYLFEIKKALKQKQKNKGAGTLKEIQISTNIAEHDLNVKANKAEKFIKDGDKVKVVLTMRGRELSRREQSKKSIFMFIDRLSDVAVAESMPKDEGNKCIVILKKK